MENSLTLRAFNALLNPAPVLPPNFPAVMRGKISQKERRRKERYLRSHGIRIRR